MRCVVHSVLFVYVYGICTHCNAVIKLSALKNIVKTENCFSDNSTAFSYAKVRCGCNKLDVFKSRYIFTQKLNQFLNLQTLTDFGICDFFGVKLVHLFVYLCHIYRICTVGIFKHTDCRCSAGECTVLFTLLNDIHIKSVTSFCVLFHMLVNVRFINTRNNEEHRIRLQDSVFITTHGLCTCFMGKCRRACGIYKHFRFD